MLIDNLVELNIIPKEELTASENSVLESEKFIGGSGDIEEGTVPIISNQTSTLKAGKTLTITKGYHTGSEIITAEGMSSQTAATATASNIESGYNAWVNGVKVDGSIPRIENATKYLNCGENHVIPYSIHNGGGKIQANDLASQTQANATSGTILSGYNAWVNGSKIDGNIQSMSGSTINPTNKTQTIECADKYMTGNIVVNPPSNLLAKNIKKGETIAGVYGACDWIDDISESNALYIEIPHSKLEVVNNIDDFISTSYPALSVLNVDNNFKEYDNLILYIDFTNGRGMGQSSISYIGKDQYAFIYTQYFVKMHLNDNNRPIYEDPEFSYITLYRDEKGLFSVGVRCTNFHDNPLAVSPLVAIRAIKCTSEPRILDIFG